MHSTRRCPFPGCKATILPDKFACYTHWMSLTPPQKNRIWDAYNLYQEGKLALDELRAVQEEVLAEAKPKGPPEQAEARCASCKAKVLWVRTAKSDALMPLDPEPATNGNIILKDGKAHYLTGDLFETTEDDGGPRYLSHFATCNDPKRFRKKPKK